MSKLKTGLAIFLLVAVAALLVISRQLMLPASPASNVSICISKNFTNAFIVLAKEKGFFAKEGVNANLVIASLGKECAEKLKSGTVDLAVAYDTPIVRQVAAGAKWRILTELHSSTRNTSIVYSRTSGIKDPGDLSGKRVAMIPGTNAEFLLELYCMAHDFDCASVQKVPVGLDDVRSLFTTGRADAVVIWEPMVAELLKSDPENLGTLRAAFYTEFSLLVATGQFVETHEAELTQVMKALFRAQENFNRHPAQAKEIALSKLGYPEIDEKSIDWSRIHLSLGLSSVLRTMLEHELDSRGVLAGAAGYDVSGGVSAMFEPKFLRAASAELVTYE